MNQGASVPHPMVSVPDAIRMVLRETIRRQLSLPKQQQKQQQQCTDSGGTSWEEQIFLLHIRNNNVFQLLGRVLAADVHMREPGYPPYAASIMDGYAVSRTTSTSAGPRIEEEEADDVVVDVWTHAVRDRVYAGDEPGTATRRGCPTSSAATTRSSVERRRPVAYYVTTGAAIPTGCDCVIPVEDVIVSDDRTLIRIPPEKALPPKPTWIRAPGSDIPAGSVVLAKGSVLDAVALGLLLQSGVRTVKVRKIITVGVLSTGNELVNVTTRSNNNDDNNNTDDEDWWSTLPLGKIPDVNRPVLVSLLRAAFPSNSSSIKVVDLGVVRDDNVGDMVKVIQKAAALCDVILTTGGISVGETDRIEDVLVNQLQGRLHFGRLHMKPGKPTTFVTLPNPNQTLVFALPGNPVSAVVCAQLLITPCLQWLIDDDDDDDGVRETANAITSTTADAYPEDADNEDSTAEHKQQQQQRQQHWLDRRVEQAYVHAEVPAVRLAHDIKLDVERPEYHRVTLDCLSTPSLNDDGSTVTTTTVATSTGIQQSSRLLSLRNTQGLLVLPQATFDHPIAKAGESYTLLLLQPFNNCCHQKQCANRVRVCDSLHLNNKKTSNNNNNNNIVIRPAQNESAVLRVGIVQIAPAEAAKRDLAVRVEKALSGWSQRGSSSIMISSQQIHSDPVDRFYSSVVDNRNENEVELLPDLDLLVVVCLTTVPGSFRNYVKLSALLRQNLSKKADAMALQARRGAAAQDPTAALFETVIGYHPRHRPKPCRDDATTQTKAGFMVILLPESGLDEGLGSVRGLLQHALGTARDDQNLTHPKYTL